MQTFRLDRHALAAAGASPVLAIVPWAVGAMHSLSQTPADKRSGADGQVGIIAIDGPLSQRAMEHLCGVSDGYDAIEARFAAALADDSIDAVVMLINSPGGDAAGMLQAAKRMKAAKCKSKKPVYAFADELAASAAYGMASVADKIFLPASGLIGSVGTVAIHFDETKALEDAGIGVRIFRSGERKFEGSSLEPMSDAAAAAMQDMVDAMAKQFAAFVGESRGMSTEDVLALEGAVFMGEDAVKVGLADDVMGLTDVLDLARASMPVRKANKVAAKALSNTKRPDILVSRSREEFDRLVSAAPTAADFAAAFATVLETNAPSAAEKNLKMSDVSLEHVNAKLGLAPEASQADAVMVIDQLQRQAAAAEAALSSQASAYESQAQTLNAEIARLSGEVERLERNAVNAEAKRLIDQAVAARKVLPATRAKAEGIFIKHGLDALRDHIDSLMPVAAAKEVREPALDPEALDAFGATALTHNGKSYENMSPGERAHLRASGEHGEKLYRELKADWERRGEPKTNRA